ncbi:MAG: HDOD domain-containing protein [Planctomycetota bacterium]
MGQTFAGHPFPQELLDAGDLPSLPNVALEILRLCRDEETTLDDLALVIERDPALAARLLRYANSSLFNLGQEVTSLQRATLVLGQKSLQLMSLSFSLARGLVREEPAFDQTMFWRRSVAHAVAARSLAGLVERSIEDEAFTCGLLSNIGQLLLARCFAPYAEVFEASGNAWPVVEQEDRILGFNRGDVGRALLESWQLPPLIYLGVGHMHHPNELPANAGPHAEAVTYLLHVSECAVRTLIDGSGQALFDLEEHFESRYGLDTAQVGEYLLTLEDAFRETAELLELPAPTDRSHEEILIEARDELLRVGMEAIGDMRHPSSASADLAHRRSIPKNQAYVDPITGLSDAVGLEEYLLCETQARASANLPQALGLILLEIDHFEDLLRTHGDEAGDDILRSVAGVLGRTTRVSDFLTHIEGCRFAVVVAETSPFGLRTFAERLRHGVHMQTISFESRALHISVSLGGASLGRVSRNSDGAALMETCLKYLERAQSKGGNRTELHATVIHHD